MADQCLGGLSINIRHQLLEFLLNATTTASKYGVTTHAN